MDSFKTSHQIRKGDPIAQMSSSQKRSSSDSYYDGNHSIGYKLNTRLRSLRTSLGWSQTELGERLAQTMGLAQKIPTSTIASWEHKIQKLQKFLHLTKSMRLPIYLTFLLIIFEDYLMILQKAQQNFSQHNPRLKT